MVPARPKARCARLAAACSAACRPGDMAGLCGQASVQPAMRATSPTAWGDQTTLVMDQRGWGGGAPDSPAARRINQARTSSCGTRRGSASAMAIAAARARASAASSSSSMSGSGWAMGKV